MKVEVYIPDTLSEITLGQYQKYLKIQSENEDENFLAIKMIEIFCGLRGDTIMSMKAKSIRDITAILTNMFNEKPKLVKEFKMGKKTYGFIPKLEGVLYRPIKLKDKEKYLIEDYKGEESEKMKNMPMDAVLSSIIFFYNLGMDLSKAMLNFLNEEEMDLVQQQILEESGDGINRFSDSLKEILEDLRISLN
jgi:hypothetical protein